MLLMVYNECPTVSSSNMSTETLDKGVEILRGATMSLESDPQYAEMLKEKERLLVSKQLLLFIVVLVFPLKKTNMQVSKNTVLLLEYSGVLQLRLWKLPRKLPRKLSHHRLTWNVHLIIRLSLLDTVVKLKLLPQNPLCNNEDFVTFWFLDGFSFRDQKLMVFIEFLSQGHRTWYPCPCGERW